MKVHGFEGTGNTASSLGYSVHGTWFQRYRVSGCESTGYIVSRVSGAGYLVSHYPELWPTSEFF